MPSAFLAGAVTVPRYENYMTPDQMLTSILVQDPYTEMATRMVWLKGRGAEAADPPRAGGSGPAEAATFTDGYDLTDTRSLKRYFRMLPEPAYRLLFNPLMRQLGTRMPRTASIPETRSRRSRSSPGSGSSAITTASRLRCDLVRPPGPGHPDPVHPRPRAGGSRSGKRARSGRAVDEMLVFDIAMTDMVKATVDKIWKM